MSDLLLKDFKAKGFPRFRDNQILHSCPEKRLLSLQVEVYASGNKGEICRLTNFARGSLQRDMALDDVAYALRRLRNWVKYA